VNWVRQEDAQGCGLAVLAMICGHGYAEVKATVDGWGWTTNQDWNKEGCTFHTLDRYLAVDGWFLQRRYDAWDELPKEPFAPIHYASVEQPSSRNHFVVVLGNGDVLDPLQEGTFRLAGWANVNQLVGLVAP
jgi:hypothetical protein